MFARIICDGAFLQKSLQYRQTFKGMSSYNYELINELEGWCLGTLGPPPPPGSAPAYVVNYVCTYSIIQV